MLNIVAFNFILFTSLQFTFASDCAPDLSSVGDSVITLSDELSDAYTAEERCEELGGYLVVTREADVNQTLINAASQKYKTITTYPDTQRVWIYYNNDTNNHYKYSLSSNESSPWVSPQHLGHLWYIDLYNSSAEASIPIRFCKHKGLSEKWIVFVNKACHDHWPEQFVLHGLASQEAGYKAIYAYDEGKVTGTSYSTRLTDVKDDNYNGFNTLKATFYAPDNDIRRVWIYYNKDRNNLYKYSLSSNEASPWVRPQHLGHLWYIDLYTSSTFSTSSVVIRFCKAQSGTSEKWIVNVDKTCANDFNWNEQFVLYGLALPEAGYKAIYAYDEGEAPWSMRLTDVMDDNFNGFNNLQGTFYAIDINITRVWIYYNEDHTNRYKYSLSSNEASPWVSPQHLGHLWYIDLYTWSTDTSISIKFCKNVSSTEKWLVAVNIACQVDWPEEFMLYGLGADSPEAGYKAIYVYDEGRVSGSSYSSRLTDVSGDNYNGFNNSKGMFYALEFESDVFIGARFDVTTQQWKWSDGEIATEFTDVGHTTCQQKVWNYEVSQISNKACSGSETYYSCQLKVTFVAHKFECNSTLLEITWKILPLALKYGKNLTVSIQATNSTSAIRTSVINKPSAIIEGLEPRSNYNITIAAEFDCDDMPDFFSSQNVETGPGSPDDVTHGYVIKTQDVCLVKFANSLPKGSFNFTISVENEVATQTEVFGQNEDCDQDICQIPIELNEYTEGGKLTFSISASNCEGITSSRPVAGNCYVQNSSKPDCSITLTKKDNSIVTLSDDYIDVTNADIVCIPLGGTLAEFKETELNEEFYQSLSDQYIRDIQRIWIYRLKSDNQVYKYSFTNIAEDDWEAPTENDHLTYLELYNRNETKLDLIYFCKAKDSEIDKWQVNTLNCKGNEWLIQFSLYGTLTPKEGFKRIYMFVSTLTGSVKLKSSNNNEPSFTFHGEFYVPDINVFVADTMNNNGECDVSTLYYGDNWALSEKPCAVTEAYYACQVEFEPRLETVPCNSHELQVIWEDNMLKLQEKAKYMTITVVANGDNIPEQQIEYSELSATIGDLTQKTSYTVTVTAKIGGCFEHLLHSVVSQTTSYGLADPVTNARVEQFQSVCTIAIPQDPTGNVIIYQVAAISPQNTTYLKYPATESDKEIRANISTKYHGNNKQVHFLIQASTCEGPNDWEPVDGFCTSPKKSGSSVGTIVGSTIGVLAAIALLGFGFIYFRRYKSGKSSKIQEQSELSPIGKEEVLIYQNVHTPSNDNLKDRLFNNYLTLSKNQFRDCKDQFKKIVETCLISNHSNSVSQLDVNLPKNLSTNIFSMDHARVKLTGNAKSDYINASYVAGNKNKKKFISTLVPQSSTMQGFWKMIWQQKSATIALISNRNDINNEEQYWPELGSNITFGKFRIKNLEENSFSDIVLRKFELRTIEDKQIITQFHYIGWPDHGTPITTTSFLRLHKMVEECHNRQTPITVQCSGKKELTGTYIAMDISFDEADTEGKVDLTRTVLEMRKCRSEMVQTWQQYLFVHKLILEHVYLPDTDYIAEKLQHMTREQIHQMAKEEFETLKHWRFGKEWIPGSPSLTTYDENCVKVWSKTQQIDKKLNASYIEGLHFGGNFIAAHCPITGEESDFWQMLLTRDVKVVVCLDENNAFDLTSGNQRLGDILVAVNKKTKQAAFQINEVEITSNEAKEKSKLVLIEVTTWKNKPPTAEDFINLINKIQEMKAKKQGKYVVVCCKNGCDKTGTFIALVNILERLKSQNRVDVFRTIKDLRDMRPNMVDNLELYVYCCSVVLDYLSSQNTYDVDIPTTDDAYVEMKETSGEPIYNTISDA